VSEHDKCSCDEAVELLGDFLCKELTPEERERVEAHLCECIECADFYQFEGKMLECVKRKVTETQLPKELVDKVLKALDECEKA